MITKRKFCARGSVMSIPPHVNMRCDTFPEEVGESALLCISRGNSVLFICGHLSFQSVWCHLGWRPLGRSRFYLRMRRAARRILPTRAQFHRGVERGSWRPPCWHFRMILLRSRTPVTKNARTYKSSILDPEPDGPLSAYPPKSTPSGRHRMG